MAHYRTLLDPGIFVGPQDFATEKTVAISRVVREAMPKRDGEATDSAPMIYFSHAGKELPRKYKAPKSVLHGLALMYGTETDAWLGKEITLFAAKCMSFGEVEECIRIRFPPAIDSKIRKWLKKRKSNPNSYIIEPGQ